MVITAGLGPDGTQRMLDAAKPSLLRVLGPNCVGLQVPGIGLDASFAHLAARPGNLALLSQSGAIVTAMVDWAHARKIGFSVVASMGEMADVDVGDLLDHLAGDPQTAAILMYLEGITEARKFMSAARMAARAKPVIVVKAGRSARASEAARSHTGALAGVDAVYDAAFARAGVLRVDDLSDLFAAAEVVARHRPLASDRLAILTNGGGAGVLAVDALSGTRAELAPLAPKTIQALENVLPANWSGGNPVDIIGDARPERYEAALEIVLADETTDALLVMACPSGLASSREAAERVAAHLASRTGRKKPVIAAWLGGESALEGARPLEEAGIPTYRTPGQAVEAFDYLVRHHKAQELLSRTPPAEPATFLPDRAGVAQLIERALAEDRPLLNEVEAKAVLAAYGIPTVPSSVARNASEAADIARHLLRDGAKSVVVKILSRDISHKSDVGGVRLNLTSPHEVREATNAMMERARAVRPGAHIEGVVVQPMIHRAAAHELILGINDDLVFGPVILFGSGGTAVEVVADKALALPPLDRTIAADLIAQTRIGALLKGYRDRPAADLAAVQSALIALAHLAADFPQIAELDINPLLADSDGVVALDARVAVRPAEAVPAGGNPRLAIRPYPSGLECVLKGRQGPITIRPIKPSDEAYYPEFLSKISAQDVRRRFFGAFSNFDHDQIARFTQIDYARAMAFVAIEGDALLGVSRLHADPDGERAEFAIVVRSDRQREGIGGALMRQLIEYAKGHGIEELFGAVLPDNSAMFAMGRKLGFREHTDLEEPLARGLALDLRAPGDHGATPEVGRQGSALL
ncbi:MAG: bifunctional acetate--CoA ligase family protein/GNAT family N-acetyltransferase [Pseudomonadota bacterium]